MVGCGLVPSLLHATEQPFFATKTLGNEKPGATMANLSLDGAKEEHRACGKAFEGSGALVCSRGWRWEGLST